MLRRFRSERARDGFGTNAHVAQLVERVLGKDEVISSILIMGSSPNENAMRRMSETLFEITVEHRQYTITPGV